MSKTKKVKSQDRYEPTGMYEILDTVELMVHAAEPALKDALTRVFSAYANDFPDEYFWATGPQAPALLHNLMFALMPPATADKAKSAQLRAV
jgi:hypothetical protein